MLEIYFNVYLKSKLWTEIRHTFFVCVSLIPLRFDDTNPDRCPIISRWFWHVQWRLLEYRRSMLTLQNCHLRRQSWLIRCLHKTASKIDNLHCKSFFFFQYATKPLLLVTKKLSKIKYLLIKINKKDASIDIYS